MKGSPFKLRSPLKQDLTMNSTIGDVGKKIKNTTLRTAAEGVMDMLSSGAYRTGKDLYNKMKERDGGHDDMMKPRKEPMLPPGVGHDESVRRGGELRKKNQEQKTQAAGAEKSSSPSSTFVTMTKKSGKLKKKKTDIIQPVAKIKPSSIVKNPKI